MCPLLKQLILCCCRMLSVLRSTISESATTAAGVHTNRCAHWCKNVLFEKRAPRHPPLLNNPDPSLVAFTFYNTLSSSVIAAEKCAHLRTTNDAMRLVECRFMINTRRIFENNSRTVTPNARIVVFAVVSWMFFAFVSCFFRKV